MVGALNKLCEQGSEGLQRMVQKNESFSDGGRPELDV